MSEVMSLKEFGLVAALIQMESESEMEPLILEYYHKYLEQDKEVFGQDVYLRCQSKVKVLTRLMERLEK